MMFKYLVLFFVLLASVSFAFTQEECSNRLAQCISSACVQAGCVLEGEECNCPPEQQAQMDALIESQCEPPYFACMDNATSGNEPECCGALVFILFGGVGAMMFAVRK